MRKIVDFGPGAPNGKVALDSGAVSGTQQVSEEPLFLPSPDRYQLPTGHLPSSADVIVVGGGLVGLATAVELARRGRRVSVICQSLNDNQTTRGLGVVLSYLPATTSELARAHGRDSSSVVQSSVDAYGWTIEKLAMIDRRFPCRVAGHLICGHHSDHSDDMKRLVEFDRQRQGKGQFLAQQEMAQQIGSKRFNGALAVADAAVVDPGQVHLGFHHLARMLEIPIFNKTRVVRIARLSRGGFELRTNHGRLRANDVVVCAGHELGKLIPALRSKVGERRTITVATESLDPELQQLLAPANRVMSTNTVRRNYWYLDPSRGQLVFSMPAQGDDLDGERRRAADFLTDVYPELAEVQVERAWFSSAPVSADRVPRVGISGGVGFAVKGGANQLAYSSWLGYQASELIMGGSPHRGSTQPWSKVVLPGGESTGGVVGDLASKLSSLLPGSLGSEDESQ